MKREEVGKISPEGKVVSEREEAAEEATTKDILLFHDEVTLLLRLSFDCVCSL